MNFYNIYLKLLIRYNCIYIKILNKIFKKIKFLKLNLCFTIHINQDFF